MDGITGCKHAVLQGLKRLEQVNIAVNYLDIFFAFYIIFPDSEKTALVLLKTLHLSVYLPIVFFC